MTFFSDIITMSSCSLNGITEKRKEKKNYAESDVGTASRFIECKLRLNFFKGAICEDC